MKKIRRLLSLVLVLVLLVSILPLSARASDFTDIPEIAELMGSQGVLAGVPDGSFQLPDTLTMSELVQMLYSLSLNLPLTQAHTRDGQLMGRAAFSDLGRASYLNEDGYLTFPSSNWSLGTITREATASMLWEALNTGTNYSDLMVQSLQAADPEGGWSQETLNQAFADAGVFDKAPTFNIVGYSVQKSDVITAYPTTTLVDSKLIQAAQAAGANLAIHNALATITVPNSELDKLTPSGSAGAAFTTTPSQTGTEGAVSLGALGGGYDGITLGIQSVNNPNLFDSSFGNFANAAQDGLTSDDLGNLGSDVTVNLRLHTTGQASGDGIYIDEYGYLQFGSSMGGCQLISDQGLTKPAAPAPNGSVSADITLEDGKATALYLEPAEAEEFLDAIIESDPHLARIVTANPADQTDTDNLNSLLSLIFENAANGTLWKRWDEESEGSIKMYIDFYLPQEYQGLLTTEGMAHLLNALGLMSEEEAKSFIEAVLALFPDSAVEDNGSKLSMRQTIAILYFTKVVYENFTQNNASLSPLAAQKYLASTMKQYRTEEGGSTGELPVGYYCLLSDGTYEYLGSGDDFESDASHYYDGKNLVKLPGRDDYVG